MTLKNADILESTERDKAGKCLKMDGRNAVAGLITGKNSRQCELICSRGAALSPGILAGTYLHGTMTKTQSPIEYIVVSIG